MMRKFALCSATALLLASMGCKADESFARESAASKVVSISFNDISVHWAKEAIEQAVEKGYVDGYEDLTFRPEQNVSRAEFLKMVITAMKVEMNSANHAEDPWYTTYVNAAVNIGIHRWDDFTTGDWNSPISRLEMARIADRATDSMLRKREVRIDDKSVIYTAAKNGLIQGLSGGELGTDKLTTRAESVTMIKRILTVNDGGKLVVDKYALNNAELALKRTNIFTVMPEFFGGTQGDWVPWNPNNLVLETPDGKYKAQLDQLIAIDLGDPNDPNLGLLPDISQLKWHGLATYSHPVKDYMNSYILYSKSTVLYNNEPTTYNPMRKGLPLAVRGLKNQDLKLFMGGDLNNIASVFVDKIGDVPAIIIPKTGIQTNGHIQLSIYAPAIPPHDNSEKVILSVKSSEVY